LGKSVPCFVQAPLLALRLFTQPKTNFKRSLFTNFKQLQKWKRKMARILSLMTIHQSQD
jgi:hypothetical protein